MTDIHEKGPFIPSKRIHLGTQDELWGAFVTLEQGIEDDIYTNPEVALAHYCELAVILNRLTQPI